MQREVGPQVASPLYLHQIQPLPPHAAGAAKKRGNPWPAVEPPENAAMGAGAAAGGNWNPSMWDWDSRAFTAKPSSDALRLGGGLNHHHHHHHQQQQPPPATAAEVQRQGGGGAGDLSLQLTLREEASMAMDVSLTTTLSSSPSPPARASQEQAVRPSKRVRSGSIIVVVPLLLLVERQPTRASSSTPSIPLDEKLTGRHVSSINQAFASSFAVDKTGGDGAARSPPQVVYPRQQYL